MRSGVMGRKSWEDWTGWRVIDTFHFYFFLENVG